MPAAVTSAGAEAIELAADFGLALDPWQCDVLHAALGECGDGRWSAFEVGLCTPRQNGKNSVIEARELAGLFLFGEQTIIHSAHEFRTAVEAMRRLEALLRDSGEAYKANRSHGEEGIVLKATGARVLFQTRTKAAARGMSGDLVILDEAMYLQPASMQALMPTLSARPNPQLWYTGSAVDQKVHPDGTVFTGVRERGLAGDSPRLCWMEWSCQEGASPTDRAARLQANPGIGYRITEEYIEDEWQAFKNTNPDGWLAERLGIGDWPSLTESAPPVFDQAVWDALCNRDAEAPDESVLVVAVAQDRSWSCVAAAGRGGAGRTVVLCTSAPGVTWVAPKLAELVEQHSVLEVVLAGDQAKVVIPDLVSAGVGYKVMTRGEQGAACAAFQEAVKASTVEHVGQGELNRAVRNARVRMIGEAEQWDRRDQQLDDSPLVAASAAVFRFGLQEAPLPALY